MVLDLDTFEEKERQKNALCKLKGARFKKIRPLKQSTLWDALEGQSSVTPDDLKRLIDSRYAYPVISLYLNLSPDKVLRERKVFLTFFNSLKHREFEDRRNFLSKLPHDQKIALEKDLAEIEDFLINYVTTNQTQTLIIFKSNRELNRVFKLPIASADALVIDVDPYIAPLEIIVEEQKRILYVEIAKDQAQFFTYHLGHLGKISELKSFVPSDSVDASIPGRAQRHRQNHLKRHLRIVADEIRKICSANRCSAIVLSGEEVITQSIREQLTNFSKKTTVTEIHLSAHHSKNDIYEQIEKVIVTESVKSEESILKDLSQYQALQKLVWDLPEVIRAQNLSLIRTLYVSISLSQKGYVCTRDHYASLTPGQCPSCGQMLVRVKNIIDELIEKARLQKIDLTVITHKPELLRSYNNIAAVKY